MSPETLDELALARQHLEDATAILNLKLAHIAAREAYLAAFHAAEALVQVRSGRAAKTHRGLRSEFARLIRSEPGIAAEFNRFLAAAYELKSIADYSATPRSITMDEATSAIATADRMIDAIAGVLGSTSDGA